MATATRPSLASDRWPCSASPASPSPALAGSPPTGTTATPPATTFTSTYGVDATPGTAAGTPTNLGTGASTVNVDLTAAPTSASASFPAGTYTAIVTATCEKQ